MKPSLRFGLVATMLFLGGCQSLNWTAKTKTTKENPVAKSETVREVPWTWSRKKKSTGTGELPPEIAAKFDKAKRGDSNKTAVEWIAEGNQQELSRNLPGARKAYESALSVDPVNAEAHHRLGILADMRQEYSVSQDHFEAALRQKPHDPNLLSDFGYSHYLRGNVHQSERFLLQALDVDSQHKQAVKNLGTLYASQGRYDDALQAFHRVRPEAEVQDLMAKYFPNGRPMPNGNAQLASARGPGESRAAPPTQPETIDPATLKGMTQQEVFELMEQRRQEAKRLREQKELAEFRPNIPQSMIEAEQRGAAPGSNARIAGREFPRDTAPVNDGMQNGYPGQNNRNVPPNLGQTVAGAPRPEWAQNPSSADNQPSKDEFWTGAPLQRGTAPLPPPNNWPSGPSQNLANNPWPPGDQGSSAGANPGGNPYKRAPWTSDEQTSARRQLEAESASFDSSRNGMSGNETAAMWNANPSAPATPQMSPQQRAYQLGMNVGPGMMFPTVGPDSNSNPPASNPNQWSGSQWSNSTTPTGYSETKATPWDGPSSNSNQWRDAPVNTAPSSPSESWGSPSMMSLPQGNTGDASPRRAAPRQPGMQGSQLPMINPGTNWGSSPNNTVRTGDRSRGFNDVSGGNQPASDVVPAWYDSPTNSPAPATRSSGTSSVPQWPYAPR